MTTPLRRLFGLLTVAAAALIGSAPAHAGPYSSLTVFGDSLSDTGNIKAFTGGATPASPPYYQGRFSDGPTWIDVLSNRLGLGAALPSLAGGSNYAFGGARTGLVAPPGSPPGILAQVAGMWPIDHAAADPSGLYVVVGGGNDMRDARSAAGGTDATRQAAAVAAATNIFNSVALLAQKGARHVLISTLPDLGVTPEAVALGKTAESTDATLRYNAAVAGLEAMLESMFADLDVMVFDMYAIAKEVRDDALKNGGGTYGIFNVVAPCNGFAGSPNRPETACAISAYSDALHPSAAAHDIIGRAAFAQVPLPATLPLLAAGLFALAAVRRRQRA